MKGIILAFIIIMYSITIQAQETPKYISELYNNLYTSIANGNQIKPKLKIKDDLQDYLSSQIVANYSPLNGTITIGSSFIQLSRKFGKDSSNARAHVLSHELSHLMLNHGFSNVIGTGFASKELNMKFKKSKENYEYHFGEMEADQWASFYAYIAGYTTNRIAPILLDSIYKHYQLTDSLLSQYPPLAERKKYAQFAAIKMKSMCEAFDFANLALVHQNYTLSAEIYKHIIQEGFTSREIYSNLGTTYILNAISLSNPDSMNYILPLQIECDSRMDQIQNRGMDQDDKIAELLNESITLFKKSITIDPDYATAYFNASMAYWLKKEYTDAAFYLQKAKDKMPEDKIYLINIFESIVKLHSATKEEREEGLATLKKLDEQGISLAARNLNKINFSTKAQNPVMPTWVKEISEMKLSSDFSNSKNILDSTFQKTKYKTLWCKEVDAGNLYRKWKYLADESEIAIQYKFNNQKIRIITEAEKKDLMLNSQSVFETPAKILVRYNDVLLTIEQHNQVHYQIIKNQ